MKINHDLKEALNRQKTFWLHTETDKPLMSAKPFQAYEPAEPFTLKNGSVAQDNTPFKTNMIDPVPLLRRRHPSQTVEGDFINSWGVYDMSWMEAILGCPIITMGGSVWAKPCLTDWNELDEVLSQSPTVWFDELISLHKMVVSEAMKEEIPVGHPLLRGPLDIAAGMLGDTGLGEAAKIYPRKLDKLLDKCTKMFIQTADSLIAETPSLEGGYCLLSDWGLWAPGTTIRFQGDIGTLFSSEMYQEQFLKFDLTISKHYEFSALDLHSSSRHLVPLYLTIPELKMIQLTMDVAPFGPPPLELLPVFQEVQKKNKCLFITGCAKRSELEQLSKNLSPVGLAFRVELLD